MDGYTKCVLTVIAVALAVIAFRGSVFKADAQSVCGLSASSPCYVTGDVRVTNSVVVLPDTRIHH